MNTLFPNGGPVHPVRLPIPGATHDIDAPQPTELHTGMSLRDHFAGLAMQARLSDYASCQSLVEAAEARGVSFAEEVAAQSFDMADEMIRAREKEPPCQP